MRLGLLMAGVLAGGSALVGQQLSDAPPQARVYVTYKALPQTVKAGKTGVLELEFQVRDGFHVNSHMPKSELLIPTVIKLQPAEGVKASEVVYPPGTAYSFSFEPNEKLDVYTGTFKVKVPVVAAAGEHTIDGSLRYQACDNAACYPPKTLPVQVVFSAK